MDRYLSDTHRNPSNSIWLRIVVVVILIAATAPAARSSAQVSSQTASTEAASFAPVATEWQTLKRGLHERGFDFQIDYIGAVFGNLSGGVSQSATYLDLIDFQLTVDADRLVGWSGTTLFLDGIGIHGGNPSRLTGDAQGVSDITAPEGWKLYEGWIQQNLFSDRFSFLIGRYDLNTEFYTLQSADLFLNSSFGIGPEFSQSGKGGPSIFPDTSVGIRATVKPLQALQLQVAVLDGVPVDRSGGQLSIFEAGDGLLFVEEVEYLTWLDTGAANGSSLLQRSSRRFHIGRTALPPAYAGKFALGGWYYTARFEDLSAVRADGSPVEHRGSGGLYLVAEHIVYQDTVHPVRRLVLFGQGGLGDGRVNRFGAYTGGGLSISALLPGRETDEAGIAVAAAYNGSHFMERRRAEGVPVRNAEVTIELTYLAQLTPRLALQPDLQYVINPDTDPRLKNALIAAIELQLTF
jgi:porin